MNEGNVSVQVEQVVEQAQCSKIDHCSQLSICTHFELARVRLWHKHAKLFRIFQEPFLHQRHKMLPFCFLSHSCLCAGYHWACMPTLSMLLPLLCVHLYIQCSSLLSMLWPLLRVYLPNLYVEFYSLISFYLCYGYFWAYVATLSMLCLLLRVRGHNWIALQCEPGVTYPYCWTVSMTLAVSHDWGTTWDHALPPPHHMVATPPYKYVLPLLAFSIFSE